jgi:hypothetical protein
MQWPLSHRIFLFSLHEPRDVLPLLLAEAALLVRVAPAN